MIVFYPKVTYYTIADNTGLRGWASELPGGRLRFKKAAYDDVPGDWQNVETSIPAFLAREQQRFQHEWGAVGSLRCAAAALGAGQFYPRIQRCFPRESFLTIVPPGRTALGPPMVQRYVREYQSSVAAARGLFAHLERIFQFIEPDPRNVNVFGHELRHLLMLACAEVESALKAVLKANQVPPQRRDRYEMRDYALLRKPMRLADWQVELRSYPDFPPISPFADWPATGPAWWQAHNETKHDREVELKSATLRATIDAVAALYVSLAAQFGAGSFEAATGSVAPMRLTANGLPPWEPNEYYVPPDLSETALDWTPIPLQLERG